jgi:hypothetical protein
MEQINIRKRIAIYLLIPLALSLLYRVVSDIVSNRLLSPLQISVFIVYVFVFLVCIVLISSDFKILKFGFLNKLYLFMEVPEIAQQKKRSFEDLLNLLKRNYFSKKYYEDTDNLQLKILKRIIDSKFCVNSTAVYESLKRGLKFNVILKEEDKINGSTIEYDSVALGLAEVEHVAKLSHFNVVKWNDVKKYTEEIKNLRKGNLSDNIRAYMEVVLEEEFQESSVEDLERACNSLEEIYTKYWRTSI